MRKGVPAVFIALLAIAALACGKKGVPYDDQPSTSLRIEIVSGNNQVGPAGFLSDSLKVRVKTSTGQPVPDITITYAQITPVDSGHFPTPTWNIRKTDDQGIAYSLYYVDTQVGVDTIRAVASGLDDSIVYFVLQVTPEAAKKFVKVSPLTTLTTVAGQPMPVPYIVRVTDKYGNPVAGHRVRYVVQDSSVVVTDSTLAAGFESDTAYTRTDASGLASATWIFSVDYPGYYFSSDLRAYDSLGDLVSFFGAGTDPGTLTYYGAARPIFAAHCFSCHPSAYSDYSLDFYYQVKANGNMIPGDTTSPLLSDILPAHELTHLNFVEQNTIIRWVVTDNAAPGMSGLNNYHDNMKPIFDAHCISCHGDASPSGSYSMTTFDGIRGDGSDAVPNAIPGDAGCRLSLKMASATADNMRLYFGADSVALADSVTRWIVVDSLRDY
ncbi:MAG: hypothetical protein PHR28_08220 [candidate division Zixibacteria bacterium]|nr:hypothetical protein [candidate division Zixibacteria bacterium]